LDEEGLSKPVYESSEGPIPKVRGQGRRYMPAQTVKSGVNVLDSAGSFGMKKSFGMNKGSNVDSKNFKNRDKIEGNFLEDDDEYLSSQGASESGELDPELFR
jgi:hypothetical protein